MSMHVETTKSNTVRLCEIILYNLCTTRQSRLLEAWNLCRSSRTISTSLAGRFVLETIYCTNLDVISMPMSSSQPDAYETKTFKSFLRLMQSIPPERLQDIHQCIPNMINSTVVLNQFFSIPSPENQNKLWIFAAISRFLYNHIFQQLTPSKTLPSATMTQNDFIQFYQKRLRSTLASALSTSASFLNDAQKQKEGDVLQYTYQLWFHVKVDDPHVHPLLKKRPPGPQGDKMLNEEKRMIKRFFICFSRVDVCVAFYLNWIQLQREAVNSQTWTQVSTLLECGVMNNREHCQKWVVDIEATFQDLYDQKLIADNHGITDLETSDLHRQVILIGCAISNALKTAGILKEPCLFTILTRHNSKKMSWHITMNALAPHRIWRQLMFTMEKDILKHGMEWLRMYQFVDKAVRNNSKSQYMQTVGSSKVSQTLKTLSTDYPCFQYDGIYNARGELLTNLSHLSSQNDVQTVMRYVSCSMMIHDPWCIPFSSHCFIHQNDASGSIDALCRTKDRKRATAPLLVDNGVLPNYPKEDCSLSVQPQPKDWDLASWNILPAHVREWMQGFVETPGVSRLSFLPSMKKSSNICENVARLTSMGKAEVVVHAYVYDNNVCPRYFKVQRRDYRHSSNSKCVVMCIRLLTSEAQQQHSKHKKPKSSPDTFPEKSEHYRLFVLCMSCKCKHIVNATNPRGWLEIFKHDYEDLMAMRRASSLSVQRNCKKEDLDDNELIDILLGL